MVPVALFPDGQVEALRKVLGECGSGSDISRVFDARELKDESGESTKWRRLYSVFITCQRNDKCASRIQDSVKA